MIAYFLPLQKSKAQDDLIAVFDIRVKTAAAFDPERTPYNMKIALTILQLLSALSITAIVLFQSGKSAGLSGAIAGVADTFLAKNKARTIDAKLARYTKYVALVFVLLTLILNIIG